MSIRLRSPRQCARRVPQFRPFSRSRAVRTVGRCGWPLRRRNCLAAHQHAALDQRHRVDDLGMPRARLATGVTRTTFRGLPVGSASARRSSSAPLVTGVGKVMRLRTDGPRRRVDPMSSTRSAAARTLAGSAPWRWHWPWGRQWSPAPGWRGPTPPTRVRQHIVRRHRGRLGRARHQARRPPPAPRSRPAPPHRLPRRQSRTHPCKNHRPPTPRHPTPASVRPGAAWCSGERFVHTAFGDTFSGPNMTGDWRSNVLLISLDDNLSDRLSSSRPAMPTNSSQVLPAPWACLGPR